MPSHRQRPLRRLPERPGDREGAEGPVQDDAQAPRTRHLSGVGHDPGHDPDNHLHDVREAGPSRHGLAHSPDHRLRLRHRHGQRVDPQSFG